MTGTATPTARPLGVRSFLVDCDVLVRRNLLAALRVPQMMLAITVQPLMFVLLFSYVLGESLGGDTYRQFLIGGIMAQTVAFNAMFSALGLATDMEQGVMNRLRVLPMSRLSIVAARSGADILINVVGLIVMTLAGLIIGWRMHNSAGEVIAGYLLALLFGYALSWVGCVVGIISRTMQATQSQLLTLLFPLTFISSAFVPSARLPTPLRIIANWNPVTSLARALRESFGNPVHVNKFIAEPVTWAAQHPYAYTTVFSVGIIVVCAPLAVAALRARSR
ncbi:putative ABC transporter, membrane protein [Gordonia polyisoprenivorans VH2]|uniref:Transport permease protein n=1 Tax=Gordonia polyisoprenivorans (strain DSM 44266 / VH2) TaxID=1112204 RepID=H6N1H4_GORPV|nr:ABC transporter permease [Gordonia polyisoprenivorans]AFA72185.1 putative ABC transporter, membrane protein [Gordonia polyisoprenivorans VH2]